MAKRAYFDHAKMSDVSPPDQDVNNRVVRRVADGMFRWRKRRSAGDDGLNLPRHWVRYRIADDGSNAVAAPGSRTCTYAGDRGDGKFAGDEAVTRALATSSADGRGTGQGGATESPTGTVADITAVMGGPMVDNFTINDERYTQWNSRAFLGRGRYDTSTSASGRLCEATDTTGGTSLSPIDGHRLRRQSSGDGLMCREAASGIQPATMRHWVARSAEERTGPTVPSQFGEARCDSGRETSGRAENQSRSVRAEPC